MSSTTGNKRARATSEAQSRAGGSPEGGAPTNGQGQAATVQALTQRLRVMEDRFQALAAASASINWLTTGDGLIEDAPHWRLFTGQTVEQARGWGWLDAIHPEDHAHAVATWREALSQRLPYIDEYRLRRADGVYRDLYTQAAPIYEDDGSVREWVGVSIDISERKQLERGLADHVAQLEAIFEAMGDAVFVYDDQGQPTHSNAASRDIYNEALTERYLALPREERRTLFPAYDMEGRVLAIEQRPVVRALRGEVFRGDDAQDIRMLTLDSGMRALSVTGAPIWRDQRIVGAVIVARDVTERRRLERQTYEAERRAAEQAREVAAALHAMTDGVAIYDAEARLLRANPIARLFLALPDVDGAEPGERTDVTLMRQLINDRARNPAEDKGVCHTEMSFRGQDGRHRDLSLNGAEILDDDGRVVGGVMVAHDVTERNHLERQRTDMLQMVGHDLASPLQAAQFYVRRRKGLLASASSDEREAQALGALEHALERIDRLVGDLQLAARIELGMLQLSRAEVDLVALTHAEVDLTAAATGREIHLEAPDSPVLVDVDASRIGQSLANLLGNAHKYSPRERPIWVRLSIQQGQARLAVRDAGPGIPQEERESIWEQFHQVKDNKPMAGSGGGLGLGLYITRNVIEAHGGEVGVDSAPGHGSTFWFTLPLLASGE